MTANLPIAAFATCTGIVIGAMTLDHYHERQRTVLLAIADNAERERDAVRQELARSEAQALNHGLNGRGQLVPLARDDSISVHPKPKVVRQLHKLPRVQVGLDQLARQCGHHVAIEQEARGQQRVQRLNGFQRRVQGLRKEHRG